MLDLSFSNLVETFHGSPSRLGLAEEIMPHLRSLSIVLAKINSAADLCIYEKLRSNRFHLAFSLTMSFRIFASTMEERGQSITLYMLRLRTSLNHYNMLQNSADLRTSRNRVAWRCCCFSLDSRSPRSEAFPWRVIVISGIVRMDS